MRLVVVALELLPDCGISRRGTELLERDGSAAWTRTKDHSINSRMLYQLSYRGMLKPEGSARVEDLISFAK